MSIRFFPILLVIALTILAIKIISIIQGDNTSLSHILVEDIHAQTGQEVVKEESTEKEAANNTQTSEETSESTGADVEPIRNTVSENKKQRDFTEVEIELLQSLVVRRNKLDEWAKEIEVKENVLNVTQKKVEQKIKQLEALKAEVVALLKQYNKKEETKIKSLVKIYESMKPKDAARIFEEMDMPVLLEVVGGMKEAKAAFILAKMNPAKANNVTLELVKRRRLPES